LKGDLEGRFPLVSKLLLRTRLSAKRCLALAPRHGRAHSIGAHLRVLAFASVLLLAAGCGGPASDVAARPVDPGLTEYKPDARPEKGDWLMLLLPAEMPHLNPITSTDAYSEKIVGKVFDSLLDRDPQTQEMKPWIAESFDVSDDKLIYTFHLRKDVKFSDGAPLTAKDVKFTFDRIMDPKVDAPQLRSYFVDVTSVELADDYTVRFTCSKPYYLHAVMIGSTPIMPEHVYGTGDFNNHPNNRAPVGSGPYVLEGWKTGLEIVLARNPHFFAGQGQNAPWFDRIVYSIITDDNASFLVLNRGDLDCRLLTPEEWIRRANTDHFMERFNRLAFNRPAYTYLGWNLRKPQLSDRRVRTALTMLMNREAVRDDIYKGFATIMTTGFMPGAPEFNDKIQPLPFDPARAVAMLDETGWKDSDGDGLRDREGVPFRFEVLTVNQNPLGEQILTLYKEELARTGIELVIRPLEWASLLDRVDKRDFDAVLMGWQMTPDPDPYQIWHSSQADKGSNYIGFVNAEADQLIDNARVSFDREERIRLYHRFQEIIHEEQPYLFLLAPKALIAVNKRIEGVRIYPFGLLDREWRDWFVPKAMQRYGQ
jgi:peptide/nickel transport system substrate-binding protein